VAEINHKQKAYQTNRLTVKSELVF